MAKRERRASFGTVLPTQHDLEKAEKERIEREEAKELEESLQEVRNTTFFLDKEVSKKFRVYCLDKSISVSQMLSSFIEVVLTKGLDEDFKKILINPTTNLDHKVTYYIQRGSLNELRALSINEETTIREILTYYILKELEIPR